MIMIIVIIFKIHLHFDNLTLLYFLLELLSFIQVYYHDMNTLTVPLSIVVL